MGRAAYSFFSFSSFVFFVFCLSKSLPPCLLKNYRCSEPRAHKTKNKKAKTKKKIKKIKKGVMLPEAQPIIRKLLDQTSFSTILIPREKAMKKRNEEGLEPGGSGKKRKS